MRVRERERERDWQRMLLYMHYAHCTTSSQFNSYTSVPVFRQCHFLLSPFDLVSILIHDSASSLFSTTSLDPHPHQGRRLTELSLWARDALATNEERLARAERILVLAEQVSHSAPSCCVFMRVCVCESVQSVRVIRRRYLWA